MQARFTGTVGALAAIGLAAIVTITLAIAALGDDSPPGAIAAPTTTSPAQDQAAPPTTITTTLPPTGAAPETATDSASSSPGGSSANSPAADNPAENNPAADDLAADDLAAIVAVANPAPAPAPPPSPAPVPSPPEPAPETTIAGPPTNIVPPGLVPNLDDATRIPITVTPSTQLIDRQPIVVSSTEWIPNATVNLVQCVGVPDQATIEACNLGRIESTSSSAAGDWTITMTVRRLVIIGATEYDCAFDDCFVGVASIFDEPYAVGTAVIAFDPDAPIPPKPTLTISPPSNLVHGDLLTVTGTGFDPGDFVSLSQCTVSGSACRYGDSVYGEVSPAGNLEAIFRVGQYIGDGGALVDCRLEPCDLRAHTGDQNPPPVVLTFDPNAPDPARPTITATSETTNLAGDDTVGVTVDPVEGYWSVSVCGGATNDPATSSEANCDYQRSGSAADGPASFDLSVHRLMVGYKSSVDCAVDECSIRLFSSAFGGVTGSLAIDFADDGTITVPSLTASPTTGLVHGQTIQVSTNPIGTNVGYYHVSQCVVGEPNACSPVATMVDEDRTNGAYYWADGILTAEGRVQRLLSVYEYENDEAAVTDHDCVTSPCVLRMYGNGLLLDQVALSFDPAAPPPAPPSLTATPTDGLADGDIVTFGVTDYINFVSVRHCPGNEPFSDACQWMDSGDEFSDDTFGSAMFTSRVRRHLRDHAGTTDIDCAESNARCSFFLFDQFNRAIDEIPLGFDPSASLFPAPTVTITPVDLLVDGQPVAVTIRSLDHSFQLYQCPSSATGRSLCDSLGSGNHEGTSTQSTIDVNVYRILDGGVDCAEDRCDIVVYQYEDGPPFTSHRIETAITFDPDAPLRPTPSITVTPTTGLHDGDTVTVRGSNFRSGATAIAYCGDPLPPGLSPASGDWKCENLPVSFAEIELDGSFTASVVVSATFGSGSGAIDCRAVNCYVAVAQISQLTDPVLLSDPLRFAPLEVVAAESQAFERVTELTHSEVSDGEVPTGAKVASAPPPAPAGAPATSPEPAPSVPHEAELTPTTEPPADPVADLLTNRGTGY